MHPPKFTVPPQPSRMDTYMDLTSSSLHDTLVDYVSIEPTHSIGAKHFVSFAITNMEHEDNNIDNYGLWDKLIFFFSLNVFPSCVLTQCFWKKCLYYILNITYKDLVLRPSRLTFHFVNLSYRIESQHYNTNPYEKNYNILKLL